MEKTKILKRYNYTAFGSVLSDSGNFKNVYRFTSQAIDENNLYYIHARYYDSSIGRFTSTDPANTGHSYNYTSGNPTNFTDPFGLRRCFIIISSGSGGLGYGVWGKAGVNVEGGVYIICCKKNLVDLNVEPVHMSVLVQV